MTKVNKNRYLKAIALTTLMGILLFHGHDAFAQVSVNTSGSISMSAGSALFSSGTNFLNALQTLLTSTWARLVAIIAVFAVGLSFMFGRLSMQVAFSVIGGIILVFGAPAIVDSIAGSL